ncbi:ATP synthase subunit beta [Aphelenchoides besseyi]|nr:ATP synthase subunit beta [Aphelenchoides besseyi]
MDSTEPTLSISKLGMKLNEAQDGRIIANLIDYVARLDVLDMRGNTLGVGAAEVIAESLSKISSLKRAVFSDMFTGRLKTEIPIVLRTLSDAIIAGKNNLLELDLSDNALGPSAIPGVEEFLSSPPCYSLQTLRFINCGLGFAGIDNGEAFMLKEFCAGRNRLEDAGAKAMSAAFKKLKTLKHIELPQNGFRSAGIVDLADGIGECYVLEHLNLNDNTFTKRGAIAMAKAIRKIENCLKVVDFGDCLCRGGTVDIVEAISDNHSGTIEEINLTGNELTPELGLRIIEICKNFPNLKKLSLGLNCYGSGYNDIFECIEENGALSYIVLGEEEDDQGSLEDSDLENDEMRRTAALVTVLLVVFVLRAEAQKKKDLRDYTDADLERLYEEWEENDEDVIPDDEKPDYEKPRKDINIEELKKESYVVEDDRILFLFKDGSRAWEGRDYILKQPNCLDITLEGNTILGAGSKKHTEL